MKFVDTATLCPEKYQKILQQLLAAIRAVKLGRTIRIVGAYKVTGSA
jgi:hypothetical protein